MNMIFAPKRSLNRDASIHGIRASWSVEEFSGKNQSTRFNEKSSLRRLCLRLLPKLKAPTKQPNIPNHLTNMFT